MGQPAIAARMCDICHTRAISDLIGPFCRWWFGTWPALGPAKGRSRGSRTLSKVGLVVRPRRRPLELAQTNPALRVCVWRTPTSSGHLAGQPVRPSRPSSWIASPNGRQN